MFCDGETFSHNGNLFRVDFRPDDTMGEPWNEHDGHGPVSDWRRAGYSGHARKSPGERPLCRDRGVTRFYDFAEAVRLAKRDGWRAPGDEAYIVGDSAKPGWLANRAAEADFKRLKDWCDGRWSWIGVVVALLDDDGDATDESASLWGIESDAGDYLGEVARELADEVVANIQARAA